MVDPGSDASAEQNPTSRAARSATGPSSQASSWASAAGGDPRRAPGASILPIRVAGWQPDSDGGVSVYGRTNQVLAGLEAAVDPNGDGDAHDAVRIALVGVVEPFASFPDAPLQTASDGALALDMLVVAPAETTVRRPGIRERRRSRWRVRGARRRGGRLRRRSPTVHVLLRSGLPFHRIERTLRQLHVLVHAAGQCPGLRRTRQVFDNGALTVMVPRRSGEAAHHRDPLTPDPSPRTPLRPSPRKLPRPFR